MRFELFCQTKLDDLIKTEAETHSKIAEIYEDLEQCQSIGLKNLFLKLLKSGLFPQSTSQELHKLKIEHSEAEKEYEEQDL